MKIIDSAKEKIQSCKIRIQKVKNDHPIVCGIIEFAAKTGLCVAVGKLGCEIGYYEGVRDGRRSVFYGGECYDKMRKLNYKYNKYSLNDGGHGPGNWSEHLESMIEINDLEKDIINYKE